MLYGIRVCSSNSATAPSGFFSRMLSKSTIAFHFFTFEYLLREYDPRLDLRPSFFLRCFLERPLLGGGDFFLLGRLCEVEHDDDDEEKDDEDDACASVNFFAEPNFFSFLLGHAFSCRIRPPRFTQSLLQNRQRNGVGFLFFCAAIIFSKAFAMVRVGGVAENVSVL